MKLDDIELATQRIKLLQEIVELHEHLDMLCENIKYVQALNKMPGIFFRIKDIVYIITQPNCNFGAVAAVLGDLIRNAQTVVFTPLDADKGIDYYKTDEGKVDALHQFSQYITDNMHAVLHELVHVDDKRNGISDSEDKSVSEDPYAYYNHPSEIRAYTQESLYIAQLEMHEAIIKGQVKTKEDLKNFCRIYRKYKKIFMKANEKNNFFYWKPSVFEDYLKNLDFVIETMGLQLAA